MLARWGPEREPVWRLNREKMLLVCVCVLVGLVGKLSRRQVGLEEQKEERPGSEFQLGPPLQLPSPW